MVAIAVKSVLEYEYFEMEEYNVHLIVIKSSLFMNPYTVVVNVTCGCNKEPKRMNCQVIFFVGMLAIMISNPRSISVPKFSKSPSNRQFPLGSPLSALSNSTHEIVAVLCCNKFRSPPSLLLLSEELGLLPSCRLFLSSVIRY